MDSDGGLLFAWEFPGFLYFASQWPIFLLDNFGGGASVGEGEGKSERGM